MRIIAGKHKGRHIQAPKNLPARPTTDRAKEALFSILEHRFHFEGLKVLDLFAGIGNISYEFSSRGVDSVTSVDQHAGCVKFIEKTAGVLDADIVTVKSDVFVFLKRSKQQFDIIFADPPYDLPEEKFGRLVGLVFDQGLLEEDGVLIVEHRKGMDLSCLPYFRELKKYGSSVFGFFEVD